MPKPLTLRLLFFSTLRDLTGVDQFDWPWPPAADRPPTVATLLADVFARWPSLAAWDTRMLVAVDLAFAGRDARLAPGQEVALMPPVQGG
jgi:molybdopterin converting factor small subunit